MKIVLKLICALYFFSLDLHSQTILANREYSYSVLKINEELQFSLKSAEVSVVNGISLLTTTTFFPVDEQKIRFIKSLLSPTNSSTYTAKILTFQSTGRFRQGTKYSACGIRQIILPKFSMDSSNPASLKLVSKFSSATTVQADSLQNLPSSVRQKALLLNGFKLTMGSLTTKQVRSIGPITIDIQTGSLPHTEFSVTVTGDSNDWLVATQKKTIYNGSISFTVVGGTEIFKLNIGDAQLSNYSSVNIGGTPTATITVTAKNCSIIIPN